MKSWVQIDINNILRTRNAWNGTKNMPPKYSYIPYHPPVEDAGLIATTDYLESAIFIIQPHVRHNLDIPAQNAHLDNGAN